MYKINNKSYNEAINVALEHRRASFLRERKIIGHQKRLMSLL